MEKSTIGRYQIIEEIGRGGMAKVYRAFDPRFKRDVAIKVMTQELLQDPILKARFEREAQTIASLEHPSIVPVYDFGEDNDRPYLVMRLMTGGTLSDLLDQGPMSLNDSIEILQRVGSALERAHQKGIIHRDLKPSNIMFDDYGDAFLADFGIARLTESAVTLTGDSVIGTPAYMSPEQIHGDKGVDGRSDIYALGVICYEMLTGQRPYQDKTPAKVMMKHIIDPVPDIRKANPNLPSGVEEIINKTMAKEPDDRYDHANELADTLASISREEKATLVSKADEPESSATPAGVVVAAGVQDITAESPDPAETAIGEPSIEMDDEYQETEVMAPAFADPEQPETGVSTTPEVMEDVPETEVAVPVFVQPEADPAGLVAEEDAPSNSRRWIVAGAILGVVALLVIATAIGGGFLLASRDESGDKTVEKPTAKATAAAIVQEPTATPRPEPTATRNPEPTADDRPVFEAEANLDEFYRHMEEQDFDAALEAIDQAIELDPDNDWYLHERSWLFSVIGDLDSALRTINLAVTLNPENPENYSRRGVIQRELGNLEAALEDGQQAIRMDRQNAGFHMDLGQTHLAMNNIDAAFAEFDRAIEIKPWDNTALGVRADAYRHIGDPQAAIQDLNRALELKPSEVWHLDQLAGVYAWELGELERGLEYFNEAIDKSPVKEGWRFHERAIVHRDLGNIEEAFADHEMAIKLEPENSYFYMERANTNRHSLGEPEIALEDFDRAIGIDPENSDAHLGRALVLFHDLGLKEEGLAAVNLAIELDPESAYKYNEREVMFVDLGDFDAAFADLGRCLDLEPEFYWCYYDRAWLFDELNDIAGAVEDLNRFIEIFPESDCPECLQEAIEYVEANS